MKYVLLIIVVFLFFCNFSLAQNTVFLKGSIQNRTSDSIIVTVNENRIAYYPKQYFAQLDDKGRFDMSFPLSCGSYYIVEIAHGNSIAEIVVQCGDSLEVKINALHFDSLISYKGRGSNIQNFVAKHTKEIGRMNHYSILLKEAMNYEPEIFLKNIENLKHNEMDFLKNNEKNLPHTFVRFWTTYFEYYNYFFMQQYPKVHQLLKLRKYTDTIPDENYTVLKTMPYAFNDSFLQIPSYLLYLTGAIESKLRQAGYFFYDKDTTQARKFQDSVNKLVYKIMPDKSAEFYFAQGLYARIRYQPLEKTTEQYSEFKKHWSNSEYISTIDKQVAIADRLAPGKIAPDFEFMTQDGNTKKLSDLHGKVVYLTFWASWCKQCVGEMMSSRKVKDYFKNKPVEFLNVSIGNDTTAENSIIRKYKIEGTFTDVAGGWDAKEAKLYGVQAMPAYFLIDQEGKFAPYIAPSPKATTELMVDINKLIK